MCPSVTLLSFIVILPFKYDSEKIEAVTYTITKWNGCTLISADFN